MVNYKKEFNLKSYIVERFALSSDTIKNSFGNLKCSLKPANCVFSVLKFRAPSLNFYEKLFNRGGDRKLFFKNLIKILGTEHYLNITFEKDFKEFENTINNFILKNYEEHNLINKKNLISAFVFCFSFIFNYYF